MGIHRKGVESFVLVVAIGFLLFVLAFFVFSMVPEDSKYRSPSKVLEGLEFGFQKKEPLGDTILIYESDIGKLGALTVQHAAASMGNFEAGYALGRVLVSEKKEAVVKNGFFSSNQKLEYEFDGSETEKAVLLFTVANSNLYGHLVVEMNDEVVYSNWTVNGTYEVENSDIKNGTNEIELKAKSSGSKFWAPTIYELKDVKLEVEKYQFKSKTMPFVVPKEIFDKWVQGTFTMAIPRYSAEGDLVVKVNGNIVYNGTPIGRVLAIPFSKFSSGIVVGENLVDFSAEGKGYYDLQQVSLDIEYAGGKAAATIKSFIIPEPHYAALASGAYIPKLRFTFREISQSPLTVTFNDKDYTFPNLGLQFSNGTAELNVTFNDLFKDFNIIKFKTNGVYEIFKVQFVAEKAKVVPASSSGSFFKKLY